VILLLNLYAWVIIARALVSWLNPDPRNPLVRLLDQATEPVLKPLRQILSPGGIGGIDISPILAIVRSDPGRQVRGDLSGLPVTLPEATVRLFPHYEAGDLSSSLTTYDPSAAVVERLLEEGDSVDLRWLVSTFGERGLADWFRERGARQLSNRSRAFWSLLLELPAPSRRERGDELWPL
jgi:hypothetical protein